MSGGKVSTTKIHIDSKHNIFLHFLKPRPPPPPPCGLKMFPIFRVHAFYSVFTEIDLFLFNVHVMYFDQISRITESSTISILLLSRYDILGSPLEMILSPTIVSKKKNHTRSVNVMQYNLTYNCLTVVLSQFVGATHDKQKC